MYELRLHRARYGARHAQRMRARSRVLDPHHQCGAMAMGLTYTYAVETMGGAVWYAVTYFPWRIGRRRMRVKRCVGYREPS
jgi:hypothetical protein